MDEVWRAVVGYESTHQVSNLGQARTVKRPHRLLGLRVYRGGYLRTTISTKNRQQHRPIHRLVAEAFIGLPPTPNHQINHIDGNKTNNRADNLEWCTVQENQLHAYAIGLSTPRRGTQHGRAKLSEAQVIEIRGLLGTMPQHAIAAIFNVRQPQIHRIATRKLWGHLE